MKIEQYSAILKEYMLNDENFAFFDACKKIFQEFDSEFGNKDSSDFFHQEINEKLVFPTTNTDVVRKAVPIFFNKNPNQMSSKQANFYKELNQLIGFGDITEICMVFANLNLYSIDSQVGCGKTNLS